MFCSNYYKKNIEIYSVFKFLISLKWKQTHNFRMSACIFKVRIISKVTRLWVHVPPTFLSRPISSKKLQVMPLMKITCTSIIYLLKHRKYVQWGANYIHIIQKTTTALKVHGSKSYKPYSKSYYLIKFKVLPGRI